MPVGFDTTILSALLNPNARLPNDPATDQPVEHARERIQGMIARLQKDKQRIIIPTPVTAELLTVIGPTNADYLQIINRSRVFEGRPFDDIAAIELAFLNRDTFSKLDTKNGLQPWQKVKIDRQILAICRVAQCEVLHTDDKGMIASAERCGMKTLRISDLPIPDEARQHNLDLEPHEEIPGGEEQDQEDLENADAGE